MALQFSVEADEGIALRLSGIEISESSSLHIHGSLFIFIEEGTEASSMIIMPVGKNSQIDSGQVDPERTGVFPEIGTRK